MAALADRLDAQRAQILEATAEDMQRASEAGVPQHIVNRLEFSEKKIDGRIRSLRKIYDLPDPVGATIRSWQCANGIEAARVRVPLGVIMMIYEARPHVTVNAGAFCLKSGDRKSVV